MGRFVLLLALLIVGLVAWSWFFPIDTGERHYVDGLIECKAGLGFFESVQQFFRNLTRGIAIILLGILFIIAAFQTIFRSSADVFEKASSAGDAWEGLQGIGMGLVVIGGGIACVASLGGMSTTCVGARISQTETTAQSFLDYEADRAARAAKKTWQSEGITGLRQNVAECYPRARELRTERSAMFCFSFDYLTATRYDDRGSQIDRLTGVHARIGRLLDYDGLHMNDRSETLSLWSDAADKAFGGPRPASSESAMPSEPSPSPLRDLPPQQPPYGRESRYDQSYCSNLVANARAMYGRRWESALREVAPQDAVGCEAQIRQARSEEAVQQQPEDGKTAPPTAVAPRQASPDEVAEHCRMLVLAAKGRFGEAWYVHIDRVHYPECIPYIEAQPR